MGGKVFTSGPEPLSTPRMTPSVYRSLLDRYLHQLSEIFERVAAPIEAPEKNSFGDIDVIVSGPKTTPFHLDQLATAVTAKRTIVKPPIYSFAVPYPDLEGSSVQLDVQLCKPEDFDWEVFHKGHGDMWNILGPSIRSFGLTANDRGLHLRVPEIERGNKKRSLVLLTADPDTVLDFLRLDKKAYAERFNTVDDMFEFACSTRFFRPEVYVRDGLKANDRKRMAQRDLYRRFVDDFMPTREGAIPRDGHAGELTREQVLEDALDRFGKRDEFEARVKAWRKEREQLSNKQETRERRKAQAMEEEAYANAWINSIQRMAQEAEV
ncbi:MAG: hypothetical protein L6R39_000773 [Caloplaca ligustica]|nr:MAG: hypothetical protein L6R39_000773 [Caloplaca ligustica]